MFSSDYIVEQATAIHADNRKKGFWDAPRSTQMIQGLIASEMMEAFEGLRKGRRAKGVHVRSAQSYLRDAEAFAVDKARFIAIYEQSIKDTVEAELAGTCIRVFDAIGGRIHEGNGLMVDTGVNREDDFTLEAIAIAASARIDACLKGAEPVTDEATLAIFPEVLIGMIPPALGIQTHHENWHTMGVALAITELNSYVETLKNMALLATWYGIDLPTFIALETAYNRTRPYRHGKKF